MHLPYYYGVLFVDGGLYQLHSVDEDAVSWLTSYGSRHTYEKKKTGDHQRTQENEESKKVPFKLLCCPKKLQSGKKRRNFTNIDFHYSSFFVNNKTGPSLDRVTNCVSKNSQPL